ncbi:hypothetical protein V8F20_003586 [Naviculisporaceae sp. PSN 640]
MEPHGPNWQWMDLNPEEGNTRIPTRDTAGSGVTFSSCSSLPSPAPLSLVCTSYPGLQLLFPGSERLDQLINAFDSSLVSKEAAKSVADEGTAKADWPRTAIHQLLWGFCLSTLPLPPFSCPSSWTKIHLARLCGTIQPAACQTFWTTDQGYANPLYYPAPGKRNERPSLNQGRQVDSCRGSSDVYSVACRYNSPILATPGPFRPHIP